GAPARARLAAGTRGWGRTPARPGRCGRNRDSVLEDGVVERVEVVVGEQVVLRERRTRPGDREFSPRRQRGAEDHPAFGEGGQGLAPALAGAARGRPGPD